MSSSPPPVAKRPRPKPKPRHAPPSDNNNNNNFLSSTISGAARAGPSRSPSIPPPVASQGRLPSSSKTPTASRTSSSSESQAIPASSQKQKEEVKPAVRRSSRPTNSLLKRDESGGVHPTWVTQAPEPEEGADDGEEEIDELEASSLETVASSGKGKGRMMMVVVDEEEEEERLRRQRQEEDQLRFNQQFQRKPRGWLDRNKEVGKGKGKGKAPSKSKSPAGGGGGRGTSAQVISDSDDEMTTFDKQKSFSDGDDDSEDGGGKGYSSSKKRSRAPAGTQKKRKLVHDWSVKEAMSSETSGSDEEVKIVGEGPSGKTKKATMRGETKFAAAREKSASLTPPPELDPMILLRVNNQVREALAEDDPSPMLARDGQASDSDDDDDFDFNLPSPRHPSPPPPRVNARAGPSKYNSNAPIVLDDSDDEVSASPAPTQAPIRQRNAKTFDAPMSVNIKVKVISHHDRALVSERAVIQFEKQKRFALDRFDTLANLFETVADQCNYKVTDLVMTNDSKRIYRSTTVDTLGIYDEALFIGYRKDIYDAEMKKKKREEAARLALLAAEAEEVNKEANDPNGGGSDDDDNDSEDAELRPLPPSHSNGNGNAPRPPPLPTQNARRSASVAGEGDNVERLHLTLRGPHGEAKFMVKRTTKISLLLKNYGTKRGLTKEIWEGLSVEDPDDEKMDSQKTIGDYEVEDNDMLSVT